MLEPKGEMEAPLIKLEEEEEGVVVVGKGRSWDKGRESSSSSDESDSIVESSTIKFRIGIQRKRAG